MLRLDSSLLDFDLNALISENKNKIHNILQDLNERSADKSDWLGWLKLHEDKENFVAIQAFAEQTIKSGKFENLVILGIGGSALGPQCLAQALLHPLWNELPKDKRQGGLKLYFIDNVDPDWNNAILSTLDIEKSLFCVITKSGGTAETASALLWVIDALKKKLGESWKQNLIAVTDPEKGTLRALVKSEGITSFPIASSVGGRFSVFSAVGMLPIALTGVKIEKFRTALEQAYNDLASPKADSSNLAASLALALIHADQKLGKNINPLMPYSSHLARVADWYVQLVAESLGKTPDIGPTPIKAVGATDQHSQLQLFAEGPKDKIIFFLKVAKFANDFEIPKEEVKGFENLAGESMKRLIHAEGQGTAKAVAKSNVPSLTIELPSVSEESLAYLLYSFEVMTAIAGQLYGIDPYNQPGVELSKKYTYAILGKAGYEQYLQDIK